MRLFSLDANRAEVFKILDIKSYQVGVFMCQQLVRAGLPKIPAIIAMKANAAVIIVTIKSKDTSSLRR